MHDVQEHERPALLNCIEKALKLDYRTKSVVNNAIMQKLDLNQTAQLILNNLTDFSLKINEFKD